MTPEHATIPSSPLRGFTLDTALPMFVYGSLRAGQHNERRLAGIETDRRAGVISGFDLLDPGYGFPYAVPGRGVLYGDVIFHDGGTGWRDTVLACDQMEGFLAADPDGSVYVRRPVTVQVDGEDRWTWMYIANRHYAHGEVVAHGDWVRHQNEKNQ